MLLTIDEAEARIKEAFEPFSCQVQRVGSYDKSLDVTVCDANGKVIENVGVILPSIFGHKTALNSILFSARERIANAGFSLAPWSES